jgi:DHA1 family multidrug/chloramphenicol efflux transport protein-like MFS transporter
MLKPLISISYHRALLFAVFLVLYEFLTYIANDMIMPGMIQVISLFHGTEAQIPSSLTVYILGGGTLQIILGPLSDAYGRRPVMLFGSIFFLLSTLAIACCQNMDQFLWARYFQGMGLCFTGAVGYALLQEIFNEGDAIRFVSWMASITIVAPLIGPLLGAFIVHHWTWRVIFYAIAILALIAAWGLWRYMPESIGKQKKDGTWFTPVSFRFISVLKNYRVLLFTPRYMLSSLAGGLAGLPAILWIAFAPIIIVKAGHKTMIEYGFWQIPVFAAAIFGNICLQKLTRKFNIIQLIRLGSLIMITSVFFMFLPFMFSERSFVPMMPGLISYFFGLSLLASPLSRYTLYITSVTKGTASALLTITWMLTEAIGIELGNIVYQSHNNTYFTLYCLIIAATYFIVSSFFFTAETSKEII